MAESPHPDLHFSSTCLDCGGRKATLPDPLPPFNDELNYLTRDYDGFRLLLLEELAARFPQRQNWTAADMEVVIAEVLAAALDQLSDRLDRVTTESYLETACQPASIRKLLHFIGYDVVDLAKRQQQGPFTPENENTEESDTARLDQFWLDNPLAMEEARLAGPATIEKQRRMVTENDYGDFLVLHPLVERAQANSGWSGAWPLLEISIICYQYKGLHTPLTLPQPLQDDIHQFHGEQQIAVPDLNHPVTMLQVLTPYVEAYRQLGTEVVLCEVEEIGLVLRLSIQVIDTYFQSEVVQAIDQALSTRAGGFFAAGRLNIGEGVRAGDIYEWLTRIDGVAHICLDTLKRIGNSSADQANGGMVIITKNEVAVCDNDGTQPHRGYYGLHVQGGMQG